MVAEQHMQDSGTWLQIPSATGTEQCSVLGTGTHRRLHLLLSYYVTMSMTCLLFSEFVK